MHDAAAAGHPVDGTRLDVLYVSQAVAVRDGPFKHVGHRGQADVWMWSDIMASTRHNRDRAEMVKKQKWSHRLPFGRRQEPADFETTAQVFFLAGQLLLNAHDVGS